MEIEKNVESEVGKVTTALLLAAGTGSRLQPLTDDVPKCLTVVGGRPILERLVENLREQGILRLVVVTGHLDPYIREFLKEVSGDIQVDFVFNPDYLTTNNIYSLWLARHVIKEPFLLVESDLVFDAQMLEGMLTPNKIAISNILPWMNGTTVTLGEGSRISSFHLGDDSSETPRYKTVNIYSLSLESWKSVVEHLGNHISGGRKGNYYEAVFAEMVEKGVLEFDAVFFQEDRWHEVDRLEDLVAAEKIFPAEPNINTAHSRVDKTVS